MLKKSPKKALPSKRLSPKVLTPQKPKGHAFFFWTLFVLGLILDQVTKMVVKNIHHTEALPYKVTHFLNIVYVENKGVSFGFFKDVLPFQKLLLLFLTIGIIIFLIFWFIKESDRMHKMGIAFVITGAFGNIIDRLRYGAVIDFLDFHYAGLHFPAFNVADALISCGAMLMIARTLVPKKKFLDN